MTNAKQEWIEHTDGNKVMAAWVRASYCYDPQQQEWDYRKNLRLAKGYSEKEYAEFLALLDFEYDSEYGGQEMFGMIWHEDGSWSKRKWHDGSEWWELRNKPSIPEWLQK